MRLSTEEKTGCDLFLSLHFPIISSCSFFSCSSRLFTLPPVCSRVSHIFNPVHFAIAAVTIHFSNAAVHLIGLSLRFLLDAYFPPPRRILLPNESMIASFFHVGDLSISCIALVPITIAPALAALVDCVAVLFFTNLRHYCYRL